ncbi:MAG: fimbrillin family protein [Candidatus Cryptobacteroides sp.]
MNKRNTVICIMAAILPACKQSTITPDVVDKRIPIRISTSISKVVDDSFETGDKIGLYVVNASQSEEGNIWIAGPLLDTGNHLDNVCYTYNGGWQSDVEHFWKDAYTKADFYCYYPYTPAINKTSEIHFETAKDQSTRESFKSCEILWGKTELASPSEEYVALHTSHRMSQLLIAVLPGKGFTEETLEQSLTKVTVNNIMTDAVLNLSNGELQGKGTASDISPWKDGGTYRAMIAPQTIEGKQLVSLVVDDLERNLVVDRIEFTSNTRKKCTITVNKINEGINVDIGGWEEDKIDYGGTLN